MEFKPGVALTDLDAFGNSLAGTYKLEPKQEAPTPQESPAETAPVGIRGSTAEILRTNSS